MRVSASNPGNSIQSALFLTFNELSYKMKIQNAILLIADDGTAKVIDKSEAMHHKGYRYNVGASFAKYADMTNEQKTIHLMGFALSLMKSTQLLDELEKIEEIQDLMTKCVYSI